jgi:hypothetical protein
LATAALVCGIAGLFVFFLAVVSIVALVLGLVADSRARKAPGPNTGLGRARAGWILGLIGVAGFVTMMIGVAATDGFDDDEVSVEELEVGQCVGVAEPSSEVISELPEAECAEPHDAEVFALGDVDRDDDEHPGTETVLAEVQAACTGQAFEDYVGRSYQESALEVYTLYPSEDAWDDGDRGYVCLAVNPDGSPLTGRVAGSGR